MRPLQRSHLENEAVVWSFAGGLRIADVAQTLDLFQQKAMFSLNESNLYSFLTNTIKIAQRAFDSASKCRRILNASHHRPMHFQRMLVG